MNKETRQIACVSTQFVGFKHCCSIRIGASEDSNREYCALGRNEAQAVNGCKEWKAAVVKLQP
jgi:hypothetical protein